MNLVAVELAIGAGAEVILHVARAADVVGVGRAAREFVEDHAQRLGHHVGQHVEATAMRHADDELAHAHLAAVLDHALKRGDHRFAAVEPEALRADIFLAEEFLPLLGFDDLVEDRLLAVGGKFDRLVLALHALLEEAALLDVGDVHVFEADIAAVILAQRVDELADGRPFETHRAAQIDLPVDVGIGEAVIFGLQILGHLALRQAERVEIGGEMAADAVGADEQLRADRVGGGLGDVFLGGRGGSCCGGSRLAALGGLGRGLHLGGIEGRGQVVGGGQRPARALPARALRGTFETFEELAPPGLDRGRVARELGVERLHERRADAGCDIAEILAFVAHRSRPQYPSPHGEREGPARTCGWEGEGTGGYVPSPFRR